jgi:hypothetical protein
MTSTSASKQILHACSIDVSVDDASFNVLFDTAAAAAAAADDAEYAAAAATEYAATADGNGGSL